MSTEIRKHLEGLRKWIFTYASDETAGVNERSIALTHLQAVERWVDDILRYVEDMATWPKLLRKEKDAEIARLLEALDNHECCCGICVICSMQASGALPSTTPDNPEGGDE